MNKSPWIALSLASIITASGCAKPSQAKIALRKENQNLRNQVDFLAARHRDDQLSLARLEQKSGITPALPTSRLSKLFTATELRFGKLTGPMDPVNHSAQGHELGVYVYPVDADGETLKAAGSFTIEAFDLNKPQAPLLGTWQFPVDQARQLWFGGALLSQYVLPCTWKQPPPPTGTAITIKATFIDELTGRKLQAQTNIEWSGSGSQ